LKDHIKLKRILKLFINDDAEYFLTRFITCSIQNFNIKNGGNFKPLLECMKFWATYAAWRVKQVESKKC